MRLASSRYGDPAGTPVLYFHGTPGSRMEARMLARAARRAGVQVIAVDRPGLGHSAPAAELTLDGWPQLVADFADREGLAEFGLAGWSGGGPYVLACLAAMPERITAVALLAPAGVRPATRLSRWGSQLLLPVLAWGARLPGLHRLAVALARAAHRVPGLAGRLPAPAVVGLLVQTWRHALHRGHRGWLQDLQAITEDWGVTLRAAGEAVAARAEAGRPVPVTVWHGARDRSVPIAEGRQVGASLGAVMVEDAEADHVTIFVRYAGQVADFLAGAAGPPGPLTTQM